MNRYGHIRRRLAALRFNPSRWKPFVRRHPALIMYAVVITPIVILDRTTSLHAFSMVLAISIGLSVADAWDEETQR